MEQNACLGIYIAPDKTTVICAAKVGGKIEIIEQFVIAAAEQDSFSFSQTAGDIAAACQEKQLTFSNVAAAIDCRLYRQQVLHSEFEEYRQIAQTIKFDAEEALAINAAEAAVAFEPVSKGLSGSEVSVFATTASIMSEIIMALAGKKLDPVIVEPDTVCLRRMMPAATKKDGDSKAMWAAISQNKCFMLSAQPQQINPQVRAFITSARQNKTALVTREVMLSAASLPMGTKLEKVAIYDATGAVDISKVGQQASIAFETLDIAETIVEKAEASEECDKLDVIIAAGAIAGLLTKSERVDFRPDFMPYQGKKLIFEKTVKILSLCLTMLFITLGVYLYMQYHKTNSYRNDLKEKFGSEYTIAMAGGKFKNGKDALGKLKREINRIKDVKSGLLSTTGEDSIEAKLTFLFEALNNVPKSIDIEIEKITVTTKTMTITGSTSSRGYLQLFGAVDKHPKLVRGPSTYEAKDNRDNFRLTIDLKQ